MRDHCSIRGCSHKCNYDYEIEDYVCTCPKLLILGFDGKTCQDPDISENTIIPESIKIEVLSTTEQTGNDTIVNRFGEVTEAVDDIETTTFELPLPNFTTLRDVPTVTTFSSNDDYEYGVVDNDPRWIYGPAPRSGNIWDYSYHQQK